MASYSPRSMQRIKSSLNVRMTAAPLPHMHLGSDFPEAQIALDNHGAKAAPEVWSRLDVLKEADRLVAAKYCPPGLVINDAMEIIQFRGEVAPYLNPGSGEASLNLFKMTRPAFAMELRSAIAAARKGNAHPAQASLCIRACAARRAKSGSKFCGSIRRRSRNAHSSSSSRKRPPPPVPTASEQKDKRDDSRNARLAEELAAAKEHLQSISEEHEATNEELRSANEEIQSSNEELQSTNEELETAKEELQSTNEELTTLNEELRHNNGDLTAVNDDLNNLLASVEPAGGDARTRSAHPPLYASAQRAFQADPDRYRAGDYRHQGRHRGARS